jgi:hypothetical protein
MKNQDHTNHFKINTARMLRGLALLLAINLNPGALLAATGPGTQIQFLSGTGKDDGVKWDFYCTAGMHSGVWTNIAVPSCWELQGFGVYNYGQVFSFRKGQDTIHLPGYTSEQGKYKTEFNVPADWLGNRHTRSRDWPYSAPRPACRRPPPRRRFHP